ncbi:sugar ABC transporter ATP-binding protein [Micromonospora sp. B11E3]|uniref:sugar ABC transporter ATP-binding protein n=1 Tax=Micromonospora sp. B11E3 TaxID=3153562 RepID=UPI00325E9C5A
MAGPETGAAASGLEFQGVSKSFPGTRALADISFAVRPSEFHALVGGNGSGKSTLIKILAGVYQGDPGGVIRLGDTTSQSDHVTPRWSRAAGIRFVHQDLGLFPQLSVTENVLAGTSYPRRRGGIDWGMAHRTVQGLLDSLGIEVAARSFVRDLRPADQTLIAVARCLSDRQTSSIHLLVLDEPTTRLPADEVHGLLERLRSYSRGGQSILYVSHRLDEVLEYADTITVLRDGRHIDTRSASEHDRSTIVEAIAGQAQAHLSRRVNKSVPGAPVLSVEGLTGGPLRDVSLSVDAGEVVAIAGLVGSGRTSLMRNIYGAVKPAAGTVVVNGHPLSPGNVAEALDRGISFVPEDRARDGAFLDLGLRENLSATTVRRYRRLGWFRRGQETGDASRDVVTYRIRTPGTITPMVKLSGGNQQKAVIARAMRTSPSVLLLDEPTQGVDVGARSDIYAQIESAVDAGSGVLLATSDLDELLHLADRVVVLTAGKISDQAAGDEITRTWIYENVYNAGDGK